MKNAKDAQSELQELFDIARSKGLAHTKKEFAELVGIHPANFSSFLSGYTNVTEQMMRKIRNAAIVAGVISENAAPVVTAESVNAPIAQTQNGNPVAQTTDPRWFELVSRKDEQIAEKDAQINRLLTLLENEQKARGLCQ